jgi:ParB-like chromosome segregation protein Spo0J
MSRRQLTRYQLLPDLSSEEFAALKADVALRGVLVPIEVDDDGQVLDGHHRLRAWQELRAEGVRVPQYPRVVRRLPDEDAKVAHALRLNLSRRHLSRSERAEVVAALRRLGWSHRRVAEVLGVSHATVGRDLAGGTDVPPRHVEGADGKRYPSVRLERPPSILGHSERDERRALVALDQLGDAAPRRTLDLRRAEARAREQRLAGGDPPDGRSITGNTWRVDCVDMRAGNLAEHSVDLVLTDPPYTLAALPLFSDLSAFCARVLRPGRLLVCYVGKLALPEEIDRLSEHLRYVWSGAVFQPGRHTSIRQHRFRAAYRQVLFFSAGPYEPRGWVHDTVLSLKVPSKDLHPWQQALEPFSRLVQTCSRPGEFVCDPFVGSGTTGVAALRAGRQFVGFDVDPRAVSTAVRRLRTELEQPDLRANDQG